MLRNRFSQKPEKTLLLVENEREEKGEKESKVLLNPLVKQFIRENPVILINGNTFCNAYKRLIMFLSEGLCCKEGDFVYKRNDKEHYLKILPLNKEFKISPMVSSHEYALEIRLN